MKLQKQKTHKKGDKQYYKYVIVIGERLVKALGWGAGNDLTANVKKDELIVRKSSGAAGK